MIDILAEKPISLEEARHLIPGRGIGTSTSLASIYRAAATGVRGVRLETVCVGGRLATSREAVRRWVERLTEVRQAGRNGRQAPADVSTVRTSGERQRASERAARELDAAMRPAKRRKAAPTVQATA